MRSFTTSVAFLVLGLGLVLSCGQRLVQFPLDGGALLQTDGGTDGGSAPIVISTIPVNLATGVALNTTVRATFSTTMDSATILAANTFTLSQGTNPVSGTVTYAGTTATFTPAINLTGNLTYTATITTNAKDLAGRALAANYVWTFTTAANSLPLTVTVTPLNNAMNVSINVRPTATFSRAMDPTTLTPSTFTLQQGLTSILGTVSYNGLTNTATFAPNAPLTAGLQYTATITTGAKDTGGTGLLANNVWVFTTSACSLSPVVLGGAGRFGALAGSTVTNTGPTSVTGDVGVSPGSAVTGFPPGTITGGAIHAADPTSATGIADLTTAYNDAAARTLCPIGVAGDIGGTTKTPGLYKSTSSLAVTTADLTLDALGDPNAVFIFQMASTLTIAPGRQIILAGSANAANIFWQVGTSATLNTTSVFQGTIMADQAITLNTGATITNGRALARIAAVTLDSNTIVVPP